METFKPHFSGKPYPSSFLDAAYAYFQRLSTVRAFPVLPSDNLATVYGLADEDLLETLAELRKLAWGESSLPSELPPIETVADAITFAMKSGP